MVAQSGLKLTVGALILLSIFVGIVTVGALQYLLPYPIVALVMGPIAATLPFWYVKRAGRKRLEKFEEQFPEAVDLIARALRAGHALPTALQMVSDEIAQPVGEEFKRLFDQTRSEDVV